MSEELVVQEQSFDLIPDDLERRTKAYALNRHPDLFQFPKGVMYLITHDNYSGGLDWQANDFGYLSLLRDDVDVEFKNWVMYANGELATKMSFKDRYTDEHLFDIDKPLISALFSVVLMKLRTDLDKVCPPGYSNDVSFKAKLPQEIRNVDDDTLFNWYHKDLFGYSEMESALKTVQSSNSSQSHLVQKLPLFSAEDYFTKGQWDADQKEFQSLSPVYLGFPEFDQEQPLYSGTYVFMAGSGLGKTTLLDEIEYALF